jgi:hypothetical protein
VGGRDDDMVEGETRLRLDRKGEVPRARLNDMSTSSGYSDVSRSFLDPSRTKYFISSYSPMIYNDTKFAGSLELGACIIEKDRKVGIRQ